MIKDYCNQTGVWKQLTTTDEYGNNSYAVPETISCRIEQKTRLMRTKDGKEVSSDTKVITPSPIKIDDLFNDRVVISVTNMTDLDGNIQGYEVYL